MKNIINEKYYENVLGGEMKGYVETKREDGWVYIERADKVKAKATSKPKGKGKKKKAVKNGNEYAKPQSPDAERGNGQDDSAAA